MLEADGGYLENETSRIRSYFDRDNHVHVLRAWVKRFVAEVKKSSLGFRRQRRGKSV